MGNMIFYRDTGGERATWENPFLGIWAADDGSRIEFRGNGTVFSLEGGIAFPGREGGPAVSAAPAARPVPAPAVTGGADVPAGRPAPAVSAAPAARPDSSEDDLRSRIISSARKYLGAHYAYGAMSPPARFDCSGFVGQAYKEAAGYAIPRSSAEIFRTGRMIERENLRPGDIIVFDTAGRGKASHVAICLNGTSMIHSVSDGPKTGVIISPLTDRYFAPRIIGYRTFVSVNLTAMNMAKGFSDSRSVTDFDFDITETAASQVDDLPITAGTGVRFDLYNETGKPGDFELFFYSLGTRRSRGDHETFSLGVKEDHLSRAFYPGPGQYKLEVLSGGTVRFEQVWKVE
jgi:cell wall-associated NlpC family hydrolase